MTSTHARQQVSAATLFANAESVQIFDSTVPGTGIATIYFDDRRIWTVDLGDDGVSESQPGRLLVHWPKSLRLRLKGHCQVRLDVQSTATSDPEHSYSGEAVFTDDPERMQLVHPLTGTPLLVNKWHRVAKSFEGMSQSSIEATLDACQELIDFVKERVGLDLFITAGTLLGAVRDGEVLPHDDDADLAFLSRHENPSDFIAESFAIEKALRDGGYDFVRHSSAHVQIMFPGHELIDEFYVDIFTYFIISGTVYLTFSATAPADEVSFLPLGTAKLHGRDFPAPHSPESFFVANYGPGWRTPDPSFRYVVPEGMQRRYYWWLNSFDAHREDWEEYHRELIGHARAGEDAPAYDGAAQPACGPAAQSLAGSVVDLGCAFGARAVELARAGKQVLGVDYSRPALLECRERLSREADVESKVTLLHANLYSSRDVAKVLKAVGSLPGVVDVLAENVLDGLHHLGRDGVLQLCRHVLGRGGKGYLQIPLSRAVRSRVAPTEPEGSQIFERDEFEQRLEFYGLSIASVQELAATDTADAHLNYVITRGKER